MDLSPGSVKRPRKLDARSILKAARDGSTGPTMRPMVLACSESDGRRPRPAVARPGRRPCRRPGLPPGRAALRRGGVADRPPGDVRPRQYVGVVGPRSAWLGVETGEAELWVHPLKLASGFHLDFRIPEYTEPVRGADVARTVEVRPEATTITYSHATFTVRQHVLAPLDEPGLLVLLEVDTYRPLEIVASFRTVLQYAWPGGLGGQYAFWSDEERAFVLSESLRKRNAFVGSPWAASASSHPAHALPDAPSTFTIPVDPARAAREMVPIAVVAGTGPRAETAAAYRRLLSRAGDVYAERRRHADELREGTLRDRHPRRPPRPRLRVGQGEPRRAARVQPGPRVRPRRRLGPLRGRRAARLRLVLRGRRRHQLPRDGGDGAVGAGRRGPALPREVPARGRQDPARGVAGGRRRAVVRRVPLRLLPRGHDAVLAARSVAAVAGERRRVAARRSCGPRRRRRGPGACPTTPTATASSRTRPPASGRSRSGRSARTSTRTCTSPRSGRGRRGRWPGWPRRAARAPSPPRRSLGGEGPGLARVALLDRGRGPPRLRRPALGEDERHAHGLAGHRGGVRAPRARPRAAHPRSARAPTRSPRTGARA